MAGKVGRSGRKAHLEDKSIEEIVKLSAKTVYDALQPDSQLSYEMRVELSSRIFMKAMPNRVESDNNLLTQLIQVYLPNNDAINPGQKLIDLESAQRATNFIPHQ